MTDQLGFFDNPLANTPGKVRHNTTVTAKKAAERVSFRTGTAKYLLLVELARRPEGATPHELHSLCGCAYPHVATTRLSELRDDHGLVEMTVETRPTPTGDVAHVWALSEKGREYVAGLQERAA